MNKPKENREEVRNNFFAVAVNNAEKKAIKKESNKMGISMSAWVRMVIAEKINRN